MTSALLIYNPSPIFNDMVTKIHINPQESVKISQPVKKQQLILSLIFLKEVEYVYCVELNFTGNVRITIVLLYKQKPLNEFRYLEFFKSELKNIELKKHYNWQCRTKLIKSFACRQTIAEHANMIVIHHYPNVTFGYHSKTYKLSKSMIQFIYR